MKKLDEKERLEAVRDKLTLISFLPSLIGGRLREKEEQPWDGPLY